MARVSVQHYNLEIDAQDIKHIILTMDDQDLTTLGYHILQLIGGDETDVVMTADHLRQLFVEPFYSIAVKEAARQEAFRDDRLGNTLG